MKFIELICPKCGAVVQVDDSATEAVCLFCSEKFAVSDAEKATEPQYEEEPEAEEKKEKADKPEKKKKSKKDEVETADGDDDGKKK